MPVRKLGARAAGGRRAKKPVRKCERKGKGWAFVAGEPFMRKAAVPKVPGRPDKRGEHLLRTKQKHYKDHGVYKTTDSEDNTVYYAHKDSL